MAMSSSKNGSQKKRQDGKLADKFRGACPPHKVKDLDALVKQFKGDEEKIQAQIMQWWEEPQVAEPEWEAVGKAKKQSLLPEKKPTNSNTNGGGVKHDPRPIIAPPRRKDGGGRGAERGGRLTPGGRFDRKFVPDRVSPPPFNAASGPTAVSSSGVPAPVTNVPVPKGAWGQALPTLAPTLPPPQLELPEPEEEEEVEPPAVIPVFPEDPTPSGLPPPKSTSGPVPTSSGNVWATRGSAHLIRAEKTKPPPPLPPVPPQPVEFPVEEEHEYEEPEEEETEEVDESLVADDEEEEIDQSLLLRDNFTGLESVLPPSVNGANINASGWEPIEPSESMSQPSVEITPVAPPPVVEPIVAEVPAMPEPIIAPLPTSAGVKPSVLNMGHWETGDQDDDDELDFGFGGFGNDHNDTPHNVPPSSSEVSQLSSSAGAPHASPARPPPGLSMPPIPAGAMLVHELENKLEGANLGPAVDEPKLPEKKDMGQHGQSTQPQSFNSGNELGAQNYPGMAQYGGYGMGMYNMGTSNGFGSMPPTQFPLGGPVAQQQQPKSQQSGLGGHQQSGGSRSGTSPQTLVQPQAPPYAMPNPTNDTGAATSNDGPNASSMPPGVGQMPSGMQGYPNPAFMYGQYNQMGHPAYAGMQYGYGQGQQFGVQGGFGYHQVMSQGGYGAPYGHDARHDEQGNHSHMRENHHGNYPKGGGGYRHNRQNNHTQGQHSGHQYGNNYQGQNYGVGGPYGNSYQAQYAGHEGQFQRGYGGSNEHYGMQQQGGVYPGTGYPDNNDQGKGKAKGPHRVQQGFQQQPVGLQGSANESGGGGWPGTGQNWGGNWQQES